MRIAYFDEAGTASEEQEPFAVVSGIAIHGDTQWHAIETDLKTIITSQVPEELWSTFYFHATHLFSDHKSFRTLLSAQRRFQILREAAGIIAKYKLPVSFGAVNRKDFAEKLKDRTPADRIGLAHQFAFGLSVTGLQGWFNRNAADEVAICVADRNDKVQMSLKQLFAMMRTIPLGHPVVSLFNFVDALHFAASEESIGLQLADIAAFFIKRHLGLTPFGIPFVS